MKVPICSRSSSQYPQKAEFSETADWISIGLHRLTVKFLAFLLPFPWGMKRCPRTDYEGLPENCSQELGGLQEGGWHRKWWKTQAHPGTCKGKGVRMFLKELNLYTLGSERMCERGEWYLRPAERIRRPEAVGISCGERAGRGAAVRAAACVPSV